MPYLPVSQSSTNPVELYYEDHGSGRPVVLIHGWPLSSASWEKQVPALLAAGYRVIAYDRRGFGLSSKPSSGYDYDTFAADLGTLLERLNLEDVALIGFSMGGGEVARYVGKHGKGRVTRAGFLGAIPPFLLKTDDNPEGADKATFDGLQAGLRADRYATVEGFFANFFNVDKLGGTRISDAAVRASWNVAAQSSAIAMIDCVSAWLTDFREDLKKFDIPTLIIHGEEDRIVPYAISGKKTAAAIPGSKLLAIPEGPHAVNWTHAEEVNAALLEFLK